MGFNEIKLFIWIKKSIGIIIITIIITIIVIIIINITIIIITIATINIFWGDQKSCC